MATARAGAGFSHAGCCSQACALLLDEKGELDWAVANPIPASARNASGAAVDKKRFEGMNRTLVPKGIDVTLTFGRCRPKKVLTRVYLNEISPAFACFPEISGKTAESLPQIYETESSRGARSGLRALSPAATCFGRRDVPRGNVLHGT